MVKHFRKLRVSIRQSLLLVLIIGYALFANAQFEDPFKVAVDFNASNKVLAVSFFAPDGDYLYKNMISVTGIGGITLKALDIPAGEEKYDALTKTNMYVYKHTTVQKYAVEGNVTADAGVTVGYQGCSGEMCFAPETKTFTLLTGKTSDVVPEKSVSEQTNVLTEVSGWMEIAGRFKIVGRISGYRPPNEFIAFLTGTDSSGESADSSLGEHGILLTLLFILLGGMALNLTPCVLPMIPVNIAIIGAGMSGEPGSRRRGFLLGGVYGLGIAFAYGILGLIVVLTGAKFGSLNSMPAFNFGIAVLFAVLSAAMFDFFKIDFSRFQGKVGKVPSKRGGIATAFVMGGVAALLAGACVAPVVISVLLLSARLYQDGHISALLLPFVLGAGMGLPWSFAGGGLSFLPRPGQWMRRVNHIFGVIIMAAAVYYASIGYHLMKHREIKNDFAAQLNDAAQEGRPVIIDFWASWCHNCSKMEETTFQDAGVKKAMENFTLIKYQAEDMNSPDTKEILNYYKVDGLPTYIKLIPEK